MEFDWNNISSNIFTITGVENNKNADKLFVSLLKIIEGNGIDINKRFTVAEIANLIPRGTAGISNVSTYNYSIMSMFSHQNYRDYFIFQNKDLSDELTSICSDVKRDNHYWEKHYSSESVWINPKYIKGCF